MHSQHFEAPARNFGSAFQVCSVGRSKTVQITRLKFLFNIKCPPGGGDVREAELYVVTSTHIAGIGGICQLDGPWSVRHPSMCHKYKCREDAWHTPLYNHHSL